MNKKAWGAAAVAAVTLALLVPSTSANAAAIGASGFLKANGSVLKTNYGTGTTVNLRGTNVGGWLTHEDWMSPLGEFAADRTGWTATASSGTASNALDGSETTRWTTGAAQAGGEWLQVDLGANTLFNRLEVDSTDFAGDYPRQYDVSVSTNGTTWVSVASAAGAADLTAVHFEPQVARYVKIAQSGTATSWWSVAEFNLFNDPVRWNGAYTASASATGGGTTASNAIDGNAATVWQSGVAQAPGQTFTLDLGANTDVDKVLFDAGSAHASDYPRTWDVQGSYDNSTWTELASGYGTNRTVIADLQGTKNMRYLRLVQNGTSTSWWSIAEIALYSGTSLDRGGWAVSASTGASPANVLDNNTSTRWTTGAAQASGQWFKVDMGALITVNNVTTDTEKNSSSETDYPRGYQLDVSRDGTTWTTVATGAGEFKATSIGFPAVAARYLRLTLTSSSGSWWSIGELTAGLYNDDYSLEDDLTSRFGTTTTQSILDEHQDTWLTTADLDNMAAMGLNFIRVPIGWNVFLNLDGTWKSNPWTKIDWIVNQAGARGMYVLIDLHTVPGGDCPWGSCGKIGPNPNGFWGSSTYQGWVEGIWKAIAARYVGNPAVAGYDLINEPLIDYSEDTDDVAQKSDYYNVLYNDVRAIDADHTIFLGAFFDWTKVAMPSTYGWTNVAYELHPYDMPNSKDWTAQNTLVGDQLSSLPSKLSSPGVPVLYGEYSLYYNDDVWARFMAGLNGLNVSWSNWAYKVRGVASDGFAYWGFYYNDTAPVPIINSDNSAAFIEKVDRFSTSNFTQNTEFTDVVSKYAGGVSSYSPTAISTTGWTATASSTASGSSTAGAIDGNSATRWSSGQAQAGGEWYQIDMGSSHTVAMVTVQTPSGSTWDYPRGFTVQLSANGTTWTTAATGIAYGWKRPIAITPQSARYIKITQTGVAPQWWSIDEVTVYSSY